MVAAKALTHRYDQAVHKAVLLDPGARAKRHGDQQATVTGPLNYLLLGSDARVDNPSLGQRSDTIILLHIPASLDRAYLISIPRDLRVSIPPFPDTGFAGSTEKINAAFGYGSRNGVGALGGVRLLSATLSQLLGIRFDGAVIVDFAGFQKVVDLLGGVDLCVDHETHSIHTGAVYHVGCQYMRPWQALDYVRQRKDQPDGDYDRQRHEQQFLKAIFERAVAQGVAGNPLKLDRMIQAVGQSLTVDTNGVPLDELVFSLRNVSPTTLVGVKVPSHPTMIGDTSYVLPDDQADSLYQAIRDDTMDTWIAANGDWVNTI
ncbi:MAG TPA: LCP family protein [Micromonosporaceae bacterium]